MGTLFDCKKMDASDIVIEWAKDKCVICGQETAYDFKTPITQRAFYVEGAGQLCRGCFQKLYSERKD